MTFIGTRNRCSRLGFPMVDGRPETAVTTLVEIPLEASTQFALYRTTALRDDLWAFVVDDLAAMSRRSLRSEEMGMVIVHFVGYDPYLRARRLLDRWYTTPDAHGPAYWADLESEIRANRLSLRTSDGRE